MNKHGMNEQRTSEWLKLPDAYMNMLRDYDNNDDADDRNDDIDNDDIAHWAFFQR